MLADAAKVRRVCGKSDRSNGRRNEQSARKSGPRRLDPLIVGLIEALAHAIVRAEDEQARLEERSGRDYG